LTPQISKRDLGGFEVFSFYPYTHIEPLLKYKYKPLGSTVYSIISDYTFKLFANYYKIDDLIYAIPIDDNIKKEYAHTAILSKKLESKNIKPIFGSLLAQNNTKYAGMSLNFRMTNRRDFHYKGKENINAILVDDIITTGTTIIEAKETLKYFNVNILFALVLADARE
jgi:competence protein ComFC